MDFTSVIFDWRGTLAYTQGDQEWVADAFQRAGVVPSRQEIDAVVDAITKADGPEGRLDAPGLDADAGLHHSVFMQVFEDAGIASCLAEALYASDSDFDRNPFATDVAETLRDLSSAGVRVAILSDIHFDIRPAFANAGIAGFVDAFALSFELRAQKPDPAVYSAVIDMLGASPETTLMVGDRSRPDGAAVEHGITTLLLPPLRGTSDRRLHRVTSLCGLVSA